MGWEGCDKSTSSSSNRHSYTAYYYVERGMHPLCIQIWETSTASALMEMSVSRWGSVVSVMGRVQGATLNLSDCYVKFKWFTQVGMRVAARSLCQQEEAWPGWCQGTSLQQPCGVGGKAGGRSDRQVSTWCLSAT